MIAAHRGGPERGGATPKAFGRPIPESEMTQWHPSASNDRGLFVGVMGFWWGRLHKPCL